MASKDQDHDDRPEAEGFRVTDRRRVHLDDGLDAAPTGEHLRESVEEAAGVSVSEDEVSDAEGIRDDIPEAPSAEQMANAADAADAAAKRSDQRGPPPMDFTTFILSLGSSAMVHLGDAPHPETGRAEVNLVMAKQTIDMLAMLEEKTRGNLNGDEHAYLEALLYDLRLRFVDATRERRT